ncbi:MAG: ketosteroid isomerase-related protein [Paracoccus sp. (in: a-proteobacteria)]|uniref:ketosteroid isomerase-related protein n=1 Tax=Paracoccus sp. TaxID=267 RepID=UPI0039E52D6B
MDSKALIAAYYRAFNAGRTDEMLTYLSEDLEHYVNEGQVRRGIEAFRAFNAHMSESYRERLADLVIFANEAGDRAAAEFTVHGSYLKTDAGLPEARGQAYVLPAGAFFTLRDGKITRLTTYYNLADWVRQVSA